MTVRFSLYSFFLFCLLLCKQTNVTGFHDNMAVTKDLSTGDIIAMCGITSNSYFPVYQGECTVPIRSCSKVHLDVNTTGYFDVVREYDSKSILSGQDSFSEELCLECGSYVVHTAIESEVTWTQIEDDMVLSHCDSSVACHAEVGSFLNIAVHAEESFHHGDYADEISWTLYHKDTNNVLLHGGSPYRASLCLPRGHHTLWQIDSWMDGNVFSLIYLCILRIYLTSD